MKQAANKRGRSMLFTEQFYHPEGWGGAQLPRDVTCHLAQCGYHVEVICGSEQYAPTEGSSGKDPRDFGVVVRRLPRLWRGAIHTRKLLRQLWFCIAAAPLLFARRRPRVFVTQTNPPLIVPLVAAAAGWHGTPLVIIAQDLYPEVLTSHGMVSAGSLLGRALRHIFEWAYRRADRVVALGSVMARRLVEKGVDEKNIVVISNWATGEEKVVRGSDNVFRRNWGLDDCFVVLYSGNLGIAHDYETPIRAVKELIADQPKLRLVFIGTGGRVADAERLANALGVSHAVQFRPLVPLALLPHSLGLADAALVTLRQGFEGLIVPSKLLGYMARGIATVYVGPQSDVQDLIERSAGGVCVGAGDVRNLVAALTGLLNDPERVHRMGAHAENFYRLELARDVGLERYRAVIDEVVARTEMGAADISVR